MGAMPSLDLGKPKKKSGLASSVVAGQFIGNVKKMNTSGRSNFAASVNLGMLGNDVSLGGSLTTNPTAILGALADDANLPMSWRMSTTVGTTTRTVSFAIALSASSKVFPGIIVGSV